MGVLPWRQYSKGEGCYHEDSTVLWERGVTMETAQWGRGLLPWRQHSELPWRQYTDGEGCYPGDSTVGEKGVAMEKNN
jgi:hypothetical protein